MLTCRWGGSCCLSSTRVSHSAELLVTHVYEILVEAFPQVVQEGALAGVGVQEHKVLDAHAIPGVQGGLHVPQDLVAPFLQALRSHRGSVTLASCFPRTLSDFVKVTRAPTHGQAWSYVSHFLLRCPFISD